MSEKLSEGLENAETYSARLHLISFGRKEPKSISYRTIDVPGLPAPHIEAVEAAEIIDEKKGCSYASLAEVPDLALVDFPEIARSKRTTPDWLSHEKRELYDRAMELGEDDVALEILSGWIDANMRSTHFRTGPGRNGRIELENANRLCRRGCVTKYIGDRLVVFTLGAGSENRTPAITAVIGAAIRLDLLPLVKPPEKVKVDLKKVAADQWLVANGDLPIHPNYLLSSYDPDGSFNLPSGSWHLPPPDFAECWELEARGFSLKSDERLSHDAELALIRLRLDEAYPDKSVLLDKLRLDQELTEEEIAKIKAASEARIKQISPALLNIDRTPLSELEQAALAEKLQARFR